MKLVQPKIRFSGLDAHAEGGGADVRFVIFDEVGEVVGTITT
jgi:hypothetical protein